MAPLLRGRTILRVRYDEYPPVFDRFSLPAKALRGKTILDVGRAGKFVLFELSDGLRLAVHLRMTGRLLFSAKPTKEPYTRATFFLAGGAQLTFADVRKFGRMRIFRGDATQALGIGIDPFDRSLTARTLRQMINGRKTPVKIWLLDQRRLAGVGNIYACEALYYAGIRPKKGVGKLARAQHGRLLASLRRVLRKAIFHRGSSVDDYVDAGGKEGEFQKQLAVYGRAGMPCRRCGTPIRRIVLGQRGTFYCPVCQR